MATSTEALGVEDQQVTVLDVAASPLLTPEPAPPPPSDANVRELRLALVCYGGVSLAIYMHGITKELEKLVAASAAYERNDKSHEFGETDTAGVYWSLLKRLEERTKVRTRVVVDVVSGTSAGGINGVFLAAAIARNRSQEPLRDMWMESGDIKRLLTGREGRPIWLKSPRIVASVIRRQPLLDGSRISRLLRKALQQMGDDQSPIVDGLESLLGADERLQLFVPITDFFGYDVHIPADDPGYVLDRTHRHIMQFIQDQRDPELDQLSPRWNDALAFSARASSSFPGAFPPLSITDFERSLKTTSFDAGQRRRLFAPYTFTTDFTPEQTHFVDGGVLDNKPFATTIAAIKLRPAATEVDRRLLYVEPDPDTETGTAPKGQVPGLVRTILASYAGIPRQEPIIGDLTELAVHNTNVARIRDVIDTSFTPVREKVRRYVADAGDDIEQTPSVGQLTTWRQGLAAQAPTDAGFVYPTYLRVRIRAVIDDFARLIAERRGYPLTSAQALFVGQVLRQWAEFQKIFERSPSGTQAQRQLLDTLDLAYHERRIRFLIAAFGWWYHPDTSDRPDEVPDRRQLDHAKHMLYSRLDELHRLAELLTADDRIATLVEGLFGPAVIGAPPPDPIGFVKERADELAEVQRLVQETVGPVLAELPTHLDADIIRLTEPWTPWARSEVLTRHAGFAIWDTITYPIEAVSGVNERDHIEVMRISPHEATAVTTVDKKELAGATLGHFGAFFTRKGRENDYLWGRLDGSERLIALLLTPAGESIDWTRAKPNGDKAQSDRLRNFTAEFKEAALHIVESERDALRQIKDRLDFVSGRVSS